MHTVRSSGHLSGGVSVSVHAGTPTPPGPDTPPGTRHPPFCGQTDACKNITFAISLQTVIIYLLNRSRLYIFWQHIRCLIVNSRWDVWSIKHICLSTIAINSCIFLCMYVCGNIFCSQLSKSEPAKRHSELQKKLEQTETWGNLQMQWWVFPLCWFTSEGLLVREMGRTACSMHWWISVGLWIFDISQLWGVFRGIASGELHYRLWSFGLLRTHNEESK